MGLRGLGDRGLTLVLVLVSPPLLERTAATFRLAAVLAATAAPLLGLVAVEASGPGATVVCAVVAALAGWGSQRLSHGWACYRRPLAAVFGGYLVLTWLLAPAVAVDVPLLGEGGLIYAVGLVVALGAGWTARLHHSLTRAAATHPVLAVTTLLGGALQAVAVAAQSGLAWVALLAVVAAVVPAITVGTAADLATARVGVTAATAQLVAFGALLVSAVGSRARRSGRGRAGVRDPPAARARRLVRSAAVLGRYHRPNVGQRRRHRGGLLPAFRGARPGGRLGAASPPARFPVVADGRARRQRGSAAVRLRHRRRSIAYPAGGGARGRRCSHGGWDLAALAGALSQRRTRGVCGGGRAARALRRWRATLGQLRGRRCRLASAGFPIRAATPERVARRAVGHRAPLIRVHHRACRIPLLQRGSPQHQDLRQLPTRTPPVSRRRAGLPGGSGAPISNDDWVVTHETIAAYGSYAAAYRDGNHNLPDYVRCQLEDFIA